MVPTVYELIGCCSSCRKLKSTRDGSYGDDQDYRNREALSRKAVTKTIITHRKTCSLCKLISKKNQ